MSRIRRWNLGLVVSLLMIGALVCGSVPALAVTKLSDEPQEFSTIKEPDRAYVYTDMRVGYGRVVALETTYTHERHTSDWQSVVSVQEYNRQELADFNALALKYPFLESLNRSVSSTNFLAEKLKTVPADDAEKITNLAKIILEGVDSFSQGQVLQKGFRIWSVDKPGESVFVPVVDQDANIVISLGPTDLVWKEFNGGDKYPNDSKTVMYSYDFGTKKKNSYPLTSHTVAFQAEYHSAVVVVESVYFYWDLAANKMTKFDSLFKIPKNYHQGGESQGSHYLGITLEPQGTYTPNRMLWLDVKTKKTFTAVYPKGMPVFAEWHVYGEFAYSYTFDEKTGQYVIWQFSFKNKQFTRLFAGKSNVSSLSLREIDGRTLWFEGSRPAKTAEELAVSPRVIIRFNADKKTVSEYEAAKYGTYQQGGWEYLDPNTKIDHSLTQYTYLAYTRGNVVMLSWPKSVTDYILGDTDETQPRSIREIMMRLQKYRLTTSSIILSKSTLPL